LELGGQTSVALAPTAREQLSMSRYERCFDLAILIVLLPAVLVMGAAIALAICLDSPGPVIYRSQRVGRGGQPFEMHKFRKMRREAGSDPVTLEDDERFTPIGRFLAATRLYELPQMWNVLRGEMRLVGPRPELECFVTQFAEHYAEILTVTPGMTGNAQLLFLDESAMLGGPDPASSYCEHILPVKIDIDLRYTRTHSLAGDLRILARTAALPVVLLRDRAHTRSHTLRRWMPTAASAIIVALGFVLVSSHMP
jgi:lipopolysaccharide/colanic/teichoic acid biosynthesis glycosyltransferase